MIDNEKSAQSQNVVTRIIHFPFKKTFLISGGSLIGIGILLFIIGSQISRPAMQALRNERAFEEDLSLYFFQVLRADYVAYREQALTLEPESTITSEQVRSSYQLFFDNAILEDYLLENYVSNSYIYNNTPSEYTADVFIQFFQVNPLSVRDLETPICSRLKALTRGDRCQDYFGDAGSFIALIQDLNAANASSTDFSAIDARFDQTLTDLNSSLNQIIQSVVNSEDRISPATLYGFGAISILLGSFLIIPTSIIYAADYIKYIRDFERNSSKAHNEAIQEAQQSLSLGESPWKNASRILDAYYQRNLGQITKIYNTSIRVMVAGFALIIVSIALGIGLAVFENKDDQQEQLIRILESQEDISRVSPEQLQILLQRPQGNSATVIALIGVGAGIITNFIGATFLFLYQATIKQASEYTESLAKTNTVGIAMEILSTLIKEETVQNEAFPKQVVDQRVIETKIEISRSLINQLQHIAVLNQL